MGIKKKGNNEGKRRMRDKERTLRGESQQSPGIEGKRDKACEIWVARGAWGRGAWED